MWPVYLRAAQKSLRLASNGSVQTKPVLTSTGPMGRFLGREPETLYVLRYWDMLSLLAKAAQIAASQTTCTPDHLPLYNAVPVIFARVVTSRIKRLCRDSQDSHAYTYTFVGTVSPGVRSLALLECSSTVKHKVILICLEIILEIKAAMP